MFFEVSKILHFMLSPVTWTGLLLLLSLIRYKRRFGKALLILTLFVFLFFSNSFIVDEFMRISEYGPAEDSGTEVFDAGIVLGGGMVTSDGGGQLIFQQNTDRILQAIELYESGKIRNILISSGSGSIVFRDMLEGALLRRYLLSIGIPDSVILVDSVSRNTYENAVYSSNIIRDSMPEGKFLLVTSALHMPRALACFEKQGIRPQAYPVGRRVGARRWDPGYLLLPDPENFMDWEKLLHEWTGYLVYKMKGYL
jgi:uncharacterized SAM-binding protein YcdF (DUF218 family)